MKYILLFLGILFITSCTQQTGLIQSCIDSYTNSNQAGCDIVLNDKYCEVRYVGEYTLTEQSKQYLPFYCMDVGDQLTYTNGVGDQMVFEITEKGFEQNSRSFSQGMNCPDDPEKVLLDCIIHERAYVRMESDSKTFLLELTTQPDQEDMTLGNVGDFLNIYRDVYQEQFAQEWSMVVDKRTLSYSMDPCMKLYDTMELNGTIFTSVIAYDNEMDCANYKYYLNESQGLIGFSRFDGVLWSLDL